MELSRKSSCLQSETHQDGIGMFPAELVTEILSWLPVASLMRFKCVSKWWNRLITSPEFPTLHLEKSLMPSSTTSLLVVIDNLSKTLHSYEIDNIEKLNPTATRVAKLTSVGVRIIGSCNGFLCLETSRTSAVLYNPSTGALHHLRLSPFSNNFYLGNKEIRGFGYDSISQDYKIVMICVSLYSITDRIKGKVYSWKMNSWKNIESLENIPDSFLCVPQPGHGVLCNETLHWVAAAKAPRTCGYVPVIFGFKLHGEACCQVPLPDRDSDYDCPYLSVFDRCLCATYGIGGSFSIWVMKEYGVKKSWTRLFEINCDYIFHAEPLTYSKSRDELLIANAVDDSLRWYDLRDVYDFRDVSFQRDTCFTSLNMVICPQTLISLETGSHTGQVHQLGANRI